MNLFSNDKIMYDLDNKIHLLHSNIDLAIAKGSEQEETLRIMKDLLGSLKICTSMTDYVEEEIYEKDLDFFGRKDINRQR